MAEKVPNGSKSTNGKSRNRNVPYLKLPILQLAIGVLLPLIAIIYIKLPGMLGLSSRAPLPFLLLFFSIVASANLTGLKGGLSSAFVASIFIFYSMATDFGPSTITGGFPQAILGCIFHLGTAYFLGLTKDKSRSQTAQLLSSNNRLEEEVQLRTGELVANNKNLQRTIEVLNEANEKLKFHGELIDQISDAVVLTDAQFRIESWNKGAENIYGWKSEQVLNKSFSQLVATEYIDDDRDEVTHRFLEKGYWEGEVLQQHADGSKLNILAAVTRLHDANGNPMGIVAVNRNITWRRQAEVAKEEQNVFLQNLLGTAPVGIYVADIRGECTYASERCAKIIGISMAACLGSGWTDGIHPDDRDEVAAKWRQAVEKQDIFRKEFRFQQQNGKIVWVVAEASPSLTSEGIYQGFIGSIMDISSRREAETTNISNMEKLIALHETSRRLSRLLNIREVGREIISTLEEMLEWKRGSVWLIDQSKQKLSLLAHSEMGLSGRALKEELQRVQSIVQKPGDGISGMVALTGKSIRTGNVNESTDYLQADGKMLSELCVPLIVKNRVLGSINVESDRTNAFSELDEQLLTILAGQAAIAIENARLYEGSQESANRLRTLKDELRSLAHHIQRVREDERTSIAREIHDEIGQMLSVIKLNLAVIARKTLGPGSGKKNDETQAEIENLYELLDRSSNNLSNLIKKLRPEVLDHLGLIPAIEWLAQDFQKRTAINCRFDHTDVPFELPDSSSLALFRITQEALSNVAKHSGATTVSISLKPGADSYYLSITDNGHGTNNGSSNKDLPFGILGMRERTTLLNGSFDFESKPGKGTSVKIQIPRPQTKEPAL